MDPHDALTRALQSVADVERREVDPADDLARARSASRRRTRRRLRLGLTGVTAAVVLGLGASALLPADRVESPGVELVAERFEATPYTFDLTPRGWSVQGSGRAR